VRKERLFKELRGRVRTAQDVLRLIEDLERRSELFVALSDPEHEYWLDLQQARTHVRELVLFQAQQMMPLLFAAYERLSPERFVAVLRHVSVVMFRYVVVSNLNTNALELPFHQAAKAILDGDARVVDDDRFTNDFSLLSVSSARKHLTKYILGHLERDVSGRAVGPFTDPATIEHVLPEHPGSDWEPFFTPDQAQASAQRLGNLSLLEAGLNRRVGNASYAEKRIAYSESGYHITRSLSDEAPEDWSPAHISRRQYQWAVRARHIWRANV
jgi:hypothetical protein